MLEWGWNLESPGHETQWTNTQQDASRIYAGQGKNPEEIAQAIAIDRQRASANAANAGGGRRISGGVGSGASGGTGTGVGAGGSSSGGTGTGGNYLYDPNTNMYSVYDGNNWIDKSRSDLGADILKTQPGWAWNQNERAAQRQADRVTDYDVQSSQKFAGMGDNTYSYQGWAM